MHRDMSHPNLEIRDRSIIQTKDDEISKVSSSCSRPIQNILGEQKTIQENEVNDKKKPNT